MNREDHIREEIAEAGRRLYFKNLVAACDGNISARVSATEILITPSGVSKGFLSPGDMIKVDYDGNVIGGAGIPAREIRMHLALYRARADVNGVVHAHPPTATAYSCTSRRSQQVLHPNVVFELGEIVVAEYAAPTTEEVAQAVMAVLTEKSNAVLLSNHGAVTMGGDVMKAYYNMETLESITRITAIAEQIGVPRYLSHRQVDALRKLAEVGGNAPTGRSEPRHSDEVVDVLVAEVLTRLGQSSARER